MSCISLIIFSVLVFIFWKYNLRSTESYLCAILSLQKTTHACCMSASPSQWTSHISQSIVGNGCIFWTNTGDRKFRKWTGKGTVWVVGEETEQRTGSTVNTSTSKRTQTVKEELKCGPASKWTQSEGAEIFGLFKREMATDSFSAAASEEEQTQIYHGATMTLKQPVLKLHRIGECMF